MKGFIYKITNKVNGKSYIGQTRYTVEFRWRQHQHKKDGTHFHLAIAKYGAENFTVETLEECEIAELDSREIFYIAKYDTYNNGYNSSTGGDGMRGHSRVLTDDKYDEIKGLYLCGFSTNKIAGIYAVDKATIQKLLKAMGVKFRSNKLNINRQEFDELVADYKSGYSLKALAKRYDCSGSGLKEYLQRKGVELREKYNIMNDKAAQMELIRDYLNGVELPVVMRTYHCSYTIFCRILSENGIDKKKSARMTAEQCLEAIEMYNKGDKVPNIAKHLGYEKSTIYTMLRKHRITA